MPFNPFHRHTPVYDPPPGSPPRPHYAPPEGPPPPPAIGTMDAPPPEYMHSDRVGHEYGALSDADPYECEAARVFCGTSWEPKVKDGNPVYDDEGNPVFQELCRNPVLSPKDFEDMIIRDCSIWKMNPPEGWSTYDTLRNFPELRMTWWGDCYGSIKQGVKIKTTHKCPTYCFLSNLPLMAGLCATGENLGVYYEIRNIRIGRDPNYSVAFGEGCRTVLGYSTDHLAQGTACKPYPGWRFPGWNRLSVGFHLDDYRTFYADDEGGEDVDELNKYHLPAKGVRPKVTDTFGCGIDFGSRGVFFTYNGTRIRPDAYGGVYPLVIPGGITEAEDGRYDVFAAIGVQGETKFEVNFGAEKFAWQEGNQPQWRVENHLGKGKPPPPYVEL